MYRESSMTTTAIMVVVWAANLAIAAVAIVMLSAIMRGAGATWMPELSFWYSLPRWALSSSPSFGTRSR